MCQARRLRKFFGEFLPPLRGTPKGRLRNPLALSVCCRFAIPPGLLRKPGCTKQGDFEGASLLACSESLHALHVCLGCARAYDRKTNFHYYFELQMYWSYHFRAIVQRGKMRHDTRSLAIIYTLHGSVLSMILRRCKTLGLA